MKIMGIILAAGKGSRMNIDIPKCGLEFLGVPIIKRIVRNCSLSLINELIVVVGYKQEYIKEILRDEVEYCIQEEQLGSANAVKCCLDRIDKGLVIIINGDMPLISNMIINKLITFHLTMQNDLSFVTTTLENPQGYGRVVEEENIIKVIEEKNATEEQKSIKNVNAGIYCVNGELLVENIRKIKKNKQTNEFHLTDIVEIMSKKYRVLSMNVDEGIQVTGVNTIEELKRLESIAEEFR